MFFLDFFVSEKRDIKLSILICLTKLIFLFLFRRKCLKIIDSNLKKRIKKIKNDLKFLNFCYIKKSSFEK